MSALGSGARRCGALLALAFVLHRPGPAAPAGASSCGVARRACLTAASERGRACRSRCARLPTPGCDDACRAARDTARDACRTVLVACEVVCGSGVVDDCGAGIRQCRAAARDATRLCKQACRTGTDAARPGCLERCRDARARAESDCGYAAIAAVAGAATLPERPPGRPADLSLLEPAERDVVAAADARASSLRTRPVRLLLGRPGTAVQVVQIRHGFPFGIPIDLRRFATAEELDWYERTVVPHAGLAVVENTMKWGTVERTEGARELAAADADVAWAESLGLPVKGHALLWGIVPPFSSSGVPPWLLSRYASVPLPPLDAIALRDTVRRHVQDLAGRYRGRLAVWDATNETLQPFGTWFVDRLGPGIVDDVFRWAHEVDPDVGLVFNEWIVEVFTGLPQPTAAQVRDRVLALRAAGVPVHAVGQQAHFVPALAYAGIPSDLSQRTRLDAYAVALDTLAEAGLPVHVTETNVIAPDAPELRAAQLEGLLRIWWGHPAVEQVVFWGPWNRVAGRDEFDVGFWDDDRALTRHGEAALSLLNERWRTRVDAVTGADGAVELVATHGEHVVQWTEGGQPRHAVFRVERGTGTARVAVATE